MRRNKEAKAKEVKNKGITLIALVITIIVLLILAGISIAMLTGENGILTKAIQAKEEATYSAAEEKVKLAILEYQTKMKSETLYNILQQIEGLEGIDPDRDGGPPYTIIVDGYIFDITEKLEIQGMGKSNGIVPEIIKVEKVTEEEKEANIRIQAKTEDKEGIEKVILIRNGVEIETKKVEGKNVEENFIVTGNGKYQIKVVGNNKRIIVSQEIVIEGLITMTGTLKAGTVINGSVVLSIMGETNDGNIAKVEIYDGQNLVTTIPIEEEKNQIEKQYQIEHIPFYEEKNYIAQIISNTQEKISTNAQQVMNEDTISTESDLKEFSKQTNEGNNFEGKTVNLISDIDLQGSDSNQWIPIGNFAGIFEGNYHVVEGIYIKSSKYKELGFFTTISENAYIQNVRLKNIEIENSYNVGVEETYAGALVGTLQGTIKNCSIELGEIYGHKTLANNPNAYNWNQVWVGGIVGKILNGEAMIDQCFANITVKAEVPTSAYCIANAGGITGLLDGEVLNCYNMGNIESSGYNSTCGGIAGHGQITSNTDLDKKGVRNSYNVGLLNQANKSLWTGGIFGRNGTASTTKKANINNCYCLNSTVYSCFVADGNNNWNGRAENVISIDEMKSKASTLGEFFEVDEKGINNGYPILKWRANLEK